MEEINFDFASKTPYGYAMGLALEQVRKALIKYEDDYYKSIPALEILGLAEPDEIKSAEDIIRLNIKFEEFSNTMDIFVDMYNSLFDIFDLALPDEERIELDKLKNKLIEEAYDKEEKHRNR